MADSNLTQSIQNIIEEFKKNLSEEFDKSFSEKQLQKDLKFIQSLLEVSYPYDVYLLQTQLLYT